MAEQNLGVELFEFEVICETASFYNKTEVVGENNETYKLLGN